MGSTLGARLRDGGGRVVVALDGRSERTRRLSGEAGLEDVGTLAALLREASFVLSVVPPEAAVDAATAVARESGDARPLVCDLNAVSPATMQRVAVVLGAAGLDTVDGSISGPPPRGPGTTRMYLSGPRAGEVAVLPIEGVERVVVERRRRGRVGREDVHRVGLQGPQRGARAGAPDGPRARDGRPRGRRSRRRGPRRPRPDRDGARDRVGQGVALRRGDGARSRRLRQGPA